MLATPWMYEILERLATNPRDNELVRLGRSDWSNFQPIIFVSQSQSNDLGIHNDFLHFFCEKQTLYDFFKINLLLIFLIS